MKKQCVNCNSAFKRGSFSFKKYGSYHCPIECLKTGDFVSVDNTCEKWSKKDERKTRVSM